MKKIYALTAFVCCMILSCHDSNNDDKLDYPQLPDSSVRRMAQHYRDLVVSHSDMVILEISLENPKLKKIIARVDSFHLIPIADANDKVSMAVQLDKNGISSFYDAQILFHRPFCPPPPGCGHTETPDLHTPH